MADDYSDDHLPIEQRLAYQNAYQAALERLRYQQHQPFPFAPIFGTITEAEFDRMWGDD